MRAKADIKESRKWERRERISARVDSEGGAFFRIFIGAFLLLLAVEHVVDGQVWWMLDALLFAIVVTPLYVSLRDRS